MNVDKAFSEIETVLSNSSGDGERMSAIRLIIEKYRTLTFKTIRELLGYHYVVPSYQRGYKWKKQQVEDLLCDIQEFSESNSSSEQFYCLQPIIVKKDGDKWHLIDGQQRLTTIYLILTFLEERPSSFGLEYNTREESKQFLATLKKKSFSENLGNGKNIDIHHFQEAMQTINQWFDNKRNDAERWKKVFLDQTRVIWYFPEARSSGERDTGTHSDEIAIFARINSGKIPLTNSELIRALFIHRSKKPGNEEVSLLQQNKIASEWDYIEQQLHDEEFWCFVTLGNPFPKKNYPNRIEFLFDLIESKKGRSKTDDTYSTFRMYSTWINQENKEVSTLWQDLKDLYYRFHEWYIDRDLYHLTGFVRLAEVGLPVKKLIEMADEQPQSKLIQSIKDTIWTTLYNKDVAKTLNADTTNYEEDKAIIWKTLLLFNVSLAAQNQNAAFFNFHSYLEGSWDIEHVRSQTPTSDKKEWCQAILDYWGTDVGGTRKELADKLQLYVAGNSEESVIEFVRKEFGEDKSQNFKHDIGNLCLLDAGTNRGYGNAPYPVKRKTIIDRIGSGQFVPQGTQNVFLKVYSSNISNMMYWQQKDADAYKGQIIDVIESLLAEGSK